MCVWSEAADQSLFLWYEQLQSLLAVALTDVGREKKVVVWGVGVGSQEINWIKHQPWLPGENALAVEDKEGHCFFFWVQGFTGGVNVYFF